MLDKQQLNDLHKSLLEFDIRYKPLEFQYIVMSFRKLVEILLKDTK